MKALIPLIAAACSLALCPPTHAGTVRALMVVSSEGVDAGKTRPGFEMDEFAQTWLILRANGIVVDVASPKGGAVEADKRPVEKRVSNNLVLKKLRVAFELKDADMHQVFEEAGFPVSKPELSALFRAPGHKNFRLCGDQMLRNFLKGLTLRFRGA